MSLGGLDDLDTALNALRAMEAMADSDGGSKKEEKPRKSASKRGTDKSVSKKSTPTDGAESPSPACFSWTAKTLGDWLTEDGFEEEAELFVGSNLDGEKFFKNDPSEMLTMLGFSSDKKTAILQKRTGYLEGGSAKSKIVLSKRDSSGKHLHKEKSRTSNRALTSPKSSPLAGSDSEAGGGSTSTWKQTKVHSSGGLTKTGSSVMIADSKSSDSSKRHTREHASPTTERGRSSKGDSVCTLLQWAFVPSLSSPRILFQKGNTIMRWTDPTCWAFAKGDVEPDIGQYFEVKRIGGNSRHFRIGICHPDFDVSQRVPQLEFSPNFVKGAYIAVRANIPIDKPRAVGVKFEKSAMLICYGATIQKVTFTEECSLDLLKDIGDWVPFVAVCGEIAVAITTENPSAEKFQVACLDPKRPSQPIQIPDIMKDLNCKQFEKELVSKECGSSLTKLTDKELDSMILPSRVKNVILDWRQDLVAV